MSKVLRFFEWLLITALILFSLRGCFDAANNSQTVTVNLIEGQVETVEGKYLLRFDVENGRYLKLDPEDQGVLLLGTEFEIPKEVTVHVENTQVNLTQNTVQNIFGQTSSEVYELKTRLAIAAAPETKTKDFKIVVVARFPAVPQVRDKIGAQAPSAVPEVRFNVSHYTRYSSYGTARFIPDLLSSVWPAVGVILGMSWLYEEYQKANRSIIRKVFAWLVNLVVISVGLYFSFLILRNLWWIFSGLWGG